MNERKAADGMDTRETDARTPDAMPDELQQANPGSSARDGARMSTADLAYGRGESKPQARTSAGEKDDGSRMSLIEERDAGGYRERWTSIQTHFIDEPRDTVSDADELVADVIQGLATRFAEERQSLEQQWQSGSEVSTEDLRQAMQHYRSFFERLLAA